MRKIAAVIASALAFAFVILAPVVIHAVVSPQSPQHYRIHVIPRNKGDTSGAIFALMTRTVTRNAWIPLRGRAKAAPWNLRL